MFVEVALFAAIASGCGFHSVVETPHGWALCAGDGRYWRARGIEKANAYGPDCGALGRPYAAAVEKAGISRDQWCARTAEWLKIWGFNTLGTACDTHLNADRRFATTEMIALSSWMRDRGEDGLIAVAPDSPCGSLANVFHPDFETVCEEAAKACCAPHRGERGFLGYYLDNERNWWGNGNWWECGMLDAVLSRLPVEHSARVEAEGILKEVGDRAVARRLYTERLAERYFSTIAAAIRRHDPNHMILGCRFAGVAGAPDEVWRACARHCDVVSLNCYPNADLKRGRLTLGVCAALLPPGISRTGKWTQVPLETMLARRNAVCGKPLVISEWSFRGADVGRPREESNGQQLPDQGRRSEAITLFLREMERMPFVVGHFFYKWTDDLFPTSDGGLPETLNWGLVSVDNVPYDKAASAFRGAHSGFGFHRVEKTVKGWTLMDPALRPWKILAIEKANALGPICEVRGGIHPYGEALKVTGISRDDWVARTTERLRDWGFNMLGTSCDGLLKKQGFAYAEMLAFGARMTKGDPAHSIRPWRGRCCEQFPNVFHPLFAEVCDEVAAAAAKKLRNDPAFLGYYLDNELCWWGEGDWYRCGMLDYVLKHLPIEHLAHVAAMKVLLKHGYATSKAYLSEPEGRRDPVRRHYTRLVAETYFRIATQAIRRHDPDHLILGCRFAGVQGAPDEVWRVAGQYCDIVSFNCYPRVNPDKDALTVDIHARPLGAKKGTVNEEDAAKEFRRLYEVSKKPLFITEWSFIGLDVGLPCTKGCGSRVPTQKDRARAVSIFLEIVNSQPFMIGSEYFMWTDDPPEGVTRASPEDCNYGLVNVHDVPYGEVVEAFRRARIQNEAYGKGGIKNE